MIEAVLRAAPRVGAGAVSLVRADARGLYASDVSRALADALAGGLSVIEVAAEPDTEALVGEVVRSSGARDRAIVVARVPDRGRPSRAFQPIPTPALVAAIDATLRATRLDAVPLALLAIRADWRDHTAWAELRGTCERLIGAGKVLGWAAALDPADDSAARIVDEPWLSAIAAPLALCQRAALPLLAAAAARPIAMLARFPLAGGALAGGIGPGMKLHPTDDRTALDDGTLERCAVVAAQLAALVKREPEVARSCAAARAAHEAMRRPDHLECMTIAELALRFVIDRGAIALPRLHRPEYVREALACAIAAPLSAALHAELDRLAESWATA